MSIQFYRPNKSSTGFACSFVTSYKSGDLFANIIKQFSWNDSTKTGSFKENKETPEKHVVIKLSHTEIGGILHAIERNQVFSSFHDFDGTPKQIKFGPYLRKVEGEEEKQEQAGFSFSISVKDKEDSTKQNRFYMAFSFSEARLLREYLMHYLHRYWDRSEIDFQIPQKEKVNKDGFTGI